MNSVQLKFFNQNITVNCDNEDKLKYLADCLNDRISQFSNNKGASDAKILYLTALSLQDELEALKQEVAEIKDESITIANEGEEKLVNTLNYVSDYIENLADKLNK